MTETSRKAKHRTLRMEASRKVTLKKRCLQRESRECRGNLELSDGLKTMEG